MLSARPSTSAALLATKLYLPPPRAARVTRTRLTAELDDALRNNHKLILISAPAGFGKTTILSEWLNPCPLSFAWLSLDSADNDPGRFLTYWLAAIASLD